MGQSTTNSDGTGNVSINGAVISTADILLNGNTSITFNPIALTTLQQQPSMAYYAKVPGSWKDF